MKKVVLAGLGLGLLLGAVLLVAACQGPAGTPSPPPAGSESGIDVSVSVSRPPNGKFFRAGDKPVLTVTLKDASGSPLSSDDFASLNLYMYGPQETTQTVTAVKLLNAETDRSKRPHHYIDLKANADVEVKNNILKYTLRPVSDELPGTYTVTLWAVLADDPLQQVFAVADTQIGTATVETQIVEREKCASCHLGADSGQFYFHHIDPGYSPTGNPSIDSWPVKTCKSCHNNDGYAAYVDPATGDRVSDLIVHRVHGVHSGAHLESEHSQDLFADYLDVVFPAEVRNCTTCHVDDRWKTEPNRAACGACHDNTWFGDAASMPATALAHPGGPQPTDQACSTCHTPDSGGVAPPISVAHKVPEVVRTHTIDLDMSAPRNGKFYAAGESPKLTIAFKDAGSGLTVDPNTITTEGWSRVRLQVSGPREGTMPVLTAAAADHSLSGSTSYIYVDLRVGAPHVDTRISRSAAAITYQLANVAGLEPGTYTVFVQSRPEGRSGSSVGLINFQVGTATVEPQVATNCASCHGDTNMHGSYPFALAPDLCKSCHDYERQISGKNGWLDSNNGFGAAPLARRVHGVHFGHYLDKPEEVHGEEDAEHFGHIIFPQDVRNCTKCHSESTAWIENPSRLACNACHDSDEALAHTARMTSDPTPEEPWSGDEIEPCTGCHAVGTDLAPDRVHDISEPYVPPYPREHPP